MSDLYVVNKSTGEIVDFDEYVLVPKSEIERRKKYLPKGVDPNEASSTKKTRQENFIWFLYNKDESMTRGLKKGTFVRLIYLSTFLDYNNRLVNNTNPAKISYKPLQDKDFIKIMKMSELSCKLFREELLESGIMIKKEDGYYLSRDMFIRGSLKKAKKKGLDCYTIRLYSEYIRKLYRSTPPKSHKNICSLFDIIPYLNYQYNTFSADLESEDFEEMNLLSITEFTKAYKIKETTMMYIIRVLKTLKISNGDEEENAVVLTGLDGHDPRNKYLFVNPKLVYAGNNQLQVLNRVSFAVNPTD